MRLELHPEARAELRSAALWYDERRARLGDDFIAEVSAALDRVGDAPESYPAWPGTRAAGQLIRKATIQRFPWSTSFASLSQRTQTVLSHAEPSYLVAFERHEHSLVLAVAHAKRCPLYRVASPRREAATKAQPRKAG